MKNKSLFVKVMAGILAFLMVSSVAATLLITLLSV